ncbi:hypothetical protein AM265_01845 [Escherichia coli]|nr:hypothetical protein AM265_01845 [Escherichia coli]
MSGTEIAGVITTQRPFQGATPAVTVAEDAFKNRQVGAGIKQVSGRHAVVTEIGAGDLHQPDGITPVLYGKTSDNALSIGPAGGKMGDNRIVTGGSSGPGDYLGDGIRIKTGFHPCHIECGGRMNAGGTLHGRRQKDSGGKHDGPGIAGSVQVSGPCTLRSEE